MTGHGRAYAGAASGRPRGGGVMVWSRERTALAVAAAVIVAALVVGLILVLGGPGPAGKPRVRVLSPFTGEPVTSLRTVLAVKIDNVAEARPPTGLSEADIVYVLPVEGGLSRVLAIFSSHVPPVTGPVRSAREDDLELLRQFGRPAFAYSGATPALLPVVHRARIADLYSGITDGYYRDSSRAAPHNLYARTQQLLAQASGASTAHDIGFRFGPAAPGGHATASESIAYPAASFTFTWSAAKRRWLVSMDGSPARTAGGVRLSAATVVIEYTTVRTSRFLEYGSRPPYAESTGSGTAVVLRGGNAYRARWSRPAADSGTVFTTASGQRMTFARGPVWIVLAAR